MNRAALALFAICSASFTACHTANTRIRQQPDFFQTLDSTTQQKIRRGEVDVGFTPQMVQLALGNPTERTNPPNAGNGESRWTYRHFHYDRRDIIRGGYRRRIVFDPVLRADTVVVEPIDDRLAAKLAPQSLRITFRDGRVTMIERVPET